MSRKPAERPEQEQLTLGLGTRKPADGAGRRRWRRGAPASTSTTTSAQRLRRVTSASTSASAKEGPAQPRIYVVSELLKAVRLTLESRFTEVRVEGEVSGLKRSGNGHVYFCPEGRGGALDCVLFSREAKQLKFTLEEGMAVRCRGRLTLYEARGKFQMTVDTIEPTGAGALALAFEQLKQRLGAEGLFDRGAQATAAVPAPPDRRRDVGVGRRHPRHRPRRAPPLSRSRSCWRPRPCRATAPRWASRRGSAGWRRSPTSTSSSSRAAAARSRICGRSTRSRSRARSSPAASR